MESPGAPVPRTRSREVPPPGCMCYPEARRAGTPSPHAMSDPANDVELVKVYDWLRHQDLEKVFTTAVDDAINYVLEGQRTRRFSLSDPKVDSDERASVGTKLQYRLIDGLGLEKVPPLDTMIAGVAVEIKGTVRDTWMIPREGQCEVTVLVKIDAVRHVFEAKIMRTHRAWLTGGDGNRDKKRSPKKAAVDRYALQLLPTTPLPKQPLRSLTEGQLDIVLGPGGMRKRIVQLFTFLPDTVIPRGTITIVGAELHDPLKRAREAKPELLRAGLLVLVGAWIPDRELARLVGFDLGDDAWVAVTKETLEPWETEAMELGVL